jgi:4'-phosphopantetheinyl transferase EntD
MKYDIAKRNSSLEVPGPRIQYQCDEPCGRRFATSALDRRAQMQSSCAEKEAPDVVTTLSASRGPESRILGLKSRARPSELTSALTSVLATALPSSHDIAFVIFSSAEGPTEAVHPQEAALLAPVISEKRRSSFLLGRAAAAQALRQLGFENPPPVLWGKNREPLWPEGIVGSITHCETWSIAIVAKRTSLRAVGIDLEDVQRVQKQDIRSQICTKSELEWIAQSEDEFACLAMVFSAKEAVFKAIHPFCRCYFDFKDVELTWDRSVEGFYGELQVDLCAEYASGFRFEVRCKRFGDMVISLFTGSTDSGDTGALFTSRLDGVSS